MATGHLNPGYGNVVSNMRRYQSINKPVTGTDLKVALNMNCEDDMELHSIRSKAREVWGQPDRQQTTYGDHYREKFTEVDAPTTSRPTSAHRKNKPHPPLVFLSTRLHSVPGYHNPDAVVGKDVYKVDASVPFSEQQRRAEMRTKYIGRPSTTAVHQYKTREELDSISDPIERQAIEARLKISRDKENNWYNLEPVREEDMYNIRGPAMYRSHRPRTVPSLHRYLREAGAQEAMDLDAIYQKGNSGYYRHDTPNHSQYTIDVGTKILRELKSTTNTRFAHRTMRGDFLMHPEWPPSMPHHRLNGLSSVDLPFVPGRR